MFRPDSLSRANAHRPTGRQTAVRLSVNQLEDRTQMGDLLLGGLLFQGLLPTGGLFGDNSQPTLTRWLPTFAGDTTGSGVHADADRFVVDVPARHRVAPTPPTATADEVAVIQPSGFLAGVGFQWPIRTLAAVELPTPLGGVSVVAPAPAGNWWSPPSWRGPVASADAPLATPDGGASVWNSVAIRPASSVGATSGVPAEAFSAEADAAPPPAKADMSWDEPTSALNGVSETAPNPTGKTTQSQGDVDYPPVTAMPADLQDPTRAKVGADIPHGQGGCGCSMCVYPIPSGPRPDTPTSQEGDPPKNGDNPQVQAAPDPSQAFQLSSLASANHTIYLDFTGHTTTGTQWNVTSPPTPPRPTIVTPAFDIDSDPSAFSTTERNRIVSIWERVSEDFAPFNVNVTTAEPPVSDLIKANAADTRWGVRVAIGGRWEDWFGQGAGGVAYVGSFNWNTDTPTFVFADTLFDDVKNITEATSHEVGHTLGLSHDGRTTPSEDYYQGHGTGATGWAPIMGVGYNRELVQWSKGEYTAANQLQDDLSIITTQNGFGYRPDDFGNTTATAFNATPTGTTLTTSGRIERQADVDYFAVTTVGSSLTVTLTPFTNSSNLDIQARLFNQAGTLLQTSNPATTLNASFNLTGLTGVNTFYVEVDGVGLGTPLAATPTGYTDYGSLGQYSITATVPAAPAVITGTLSEDWNGNGLRDANDPGRAGQVVYVDANGNATQDANEQWTTTTADGAYTLVAAVGTVTVRHSVPSGWVSTGPASNSVNVTALGTTYPGNNFASARNGRVYTNAFNDTNGNGVVNGGEGPVAGRTLFADTNGNGTFDSGSTTTTVSSGTISVNIPDNTTVFHDLTVSGLTGTLLDINVRVNLTHTFVGDLNINLISPTGTRVPLALRRGGGGDNMVNTVFDDEAATAIAAGAAPFTGSFRPDSMLSAVDGQAVNGVWRLEVQDADGGDIGTLTEWAVIVTSVTGEPSVVTDALGNAFLDLPNATHQVRVTGQSGWAFTAPADGKHTVTVASAPIFQRTFGTVQPVTPTAPTVLVNGTVAPSASVTRSRVTSLVLTFNTPVTVQAEAFSLTNGTTTLTSAASGGILATANGTTVTLTFAAVAGVDAGSLSDGLWTLSTDLTRVTNLLAGTGTGTAPQANIRRLFGDVNSDGTVDGADFGEFGNSWGQSAGDAGFNVAFDFNNDQTVDGADFGEFGNRWGVQL